jgi:hypothetical protein
LWLSELKGERSSLLRKLTFTNWNKFQFYLSMSVSENWSCVVLMIKEWGSWLIVEKFVKYWLLSFNSFQNSSFTHLMTKNEIVSNLNKKFIDLVDISFWVHKTFNLLFTHISSWIEILSKSRKDWWIYERSKFDDFITSTSKCCSNVWSLFREGTQPIIVMEYCSGHLSRLDNKFTVRNQMFGCLDAWDCCLAKGITTLRYMMSGNHQRYSSF